MSSSPHLFQDLVSRICGLRIQTGTVWWECFRAFWEQDVGASGRSCHDVDVQIHHGAAGLHDDVTVGTLSI